jgi:hypothetical protein
MNLTCAIGGALVMAIYHFQNMPTPIYRMALTVVSLVVACAVLCPPAVWCQWKLGSLSAKYESGGKGPEAVSPGKDLGGVSYGTYQLSSKVGRADAFVQKYYPDLFQGLKAGTPEFTAQWKKLAAQDPKGLHEKEHQYIKETHYDKLVARLEKNLNLKAVSRSNALEDVLWSTAVQHGPNTPVVENALQPLLKEKAIEGLTDREIIVAIYAERGKKNEKGDLHYFKGNSTAIQKAVANRFVNEQKDALAALEKELGSNK